MNETNLKKGKPTWNEIFSNWPVDANLPSLTHSYMKVIFWFYLRSLIFKRKLFQSTLALSSQKVIVIFLYFSVIHSSNRQEKSCQISVWLFCLFQCFRNQQWLVSKSNQKIYPKSNHLMYTFLSFKLYYTLVQANSNQKIAINLRRGCTIQ